MESPTAPFTYVQTGTQWKATAQSRIGPLTAHGNSMDEARTALEQIVAIARAIEITRNHAHH